jgi:hypothetical protein
MFTFYSNPDNDEYRNLHTRHPLFSETISYAVHNDHIRFFKPTACYNGRRLKPCNRKGLYSVKIKTSIPCGKYSDWEENDGVDVILYTKDYSNQ